MKKLVISHKDKLPLTNNKLMFVDQGYTELWSFSTANTTNNAAVSNIAISSNNTTYWRTSQEDPYIGMVALTASGALLTSTMSSFNGQAPPNDVLIGPPVTYPSANAMAVDSNDNLYVFGLASISVGAKYPTVLKKYNQSLTTELLCITYSLPTGLYLGTQMGICIDSSNNFYLGTGRVTGASGTYSIRKYNSSGSLQWSYDPGVDVNTVACDTNWLYFATSTSQLRKINLSAGSASTIVTASYSISSIDVDNSGNIYVYETRVSPIRHQVRKYNSSGVSQWVKIVSDGQGTSAYPKFPMALDRSNGRVYVSVPTKGVDIIDTNGNTLTTIVFNQQNFVYGCVGIGFKSPHLYVSCEHDSSGPFPGSGGGFYKKLLITI